MNRVFLPACAALALLTAPVWAQSTTSEPDNRPSMAESIPWQGPEQTFAGLIGREVRSLENDQVIGEIADAFIANNGKTVALINIEDQDKTVAVDLAQLERLGGTVYLNMPNDEVAELPDLSEEISPPRNEGTALPYGGMTPGWGSPQGGASQEWR
ncbi:MAG: hypothetical protein K2Q10_08945 [Rhodospirillales bacterium]|nr:hypothetical protein [Rhodospirillales bacterium]